MSAPQRTTQRPQQLGLRRSTTCGSRPMHLVIAAAAADLPRCAPSPPSFGLPASTISTISAPLMAPRRGALDMGGDSMSDGGGPGSARGSGVGGALGGRVSGASLSGSEIEALYSDISLIHRGR